MSEYQYYEFQAVDRPLTPGEMAELRKLSTRARITPTQLQNVYHFGDFRGKPLDLMERYFDAFVYVANWGTHQFMVRLPRDLCDPRAAQAYAGEDEDSLIVHEKGDVVILEFISHDDEGGGWIDDEEAEGWMPALLPLRAALASGDQRALYLAWLAAAKAGAFEDFEAEEIEPPIPPGLGQLSASLAALASFLRVSDALVAVAATRSVALQAAPSPDDLQRWIANLPAAEKDALLLQVAGNAARAHAEITRRFQQAHTPPMVARSDGRSVAQLLAEANERAAALERKEAERQAAERARREREAAIARAAYLDRLAGREEELWRQASSLIAAMKPKEYDQAVQLLTDLRDLGERGHQAGDFAARLGSLREEYAKRRGLIDRMNKAGLRA
jgi:hypothetical protein